MSEKIRRKSLNRIWLTISKTCRRDYFSEVSFSAQANSPELFAAREIQKTLLPNFDLMKRNHYENKHVRNTVDLPPIVTSQDTYNSSFNIDLHCIQIHPSVSKPHNLDTDSQHK